MYWNVLTYVIYVVLWCVIPFSFVIYCCVYYYYILCCFIMICVVCVVLCCLINFWCTILCWYMLLYITLWCALHNIMSFNLVMLWCYTFFSDLRCSMLCYVILFLRCCNDLYEFAFFTIICIIFYLVMYFFCVAFYFVMMSCFVL